MVADLSRYASPLFLMHSIMEKTKVVKYLKLNVKLNLNMQLTIIDTQTHLK